MKKRWWPYPLNTRGGYTCHAYVILLSESVPGGSEKKGKQPGRDGDGSETSVLPRNNYWLEINNN